MPKSDLAKGGYDLAACVQWRLQKVNDVAAVKIEQLREVIAENPDVEEAGGGRKSKGLEEWRIAKAGIAKLDLKEKERAVINRAMVHEAFGIIFGLLRAASQRLRDRHGAKAGKVLDVCFVQMEREIKAHFGDAPEKEE